MSSNNLTIFPEFATTSTSLNLVHCIEQFESGRGSVYIIDEKGEYTGFAVTKKSFRKIWQSIDDSIVAVPSIDNDADNQKKLQQALQIFNKYPTLAEIPLIKNNRIMAVIISEFPAAPKNFLWDKITDRHIVNIGMAKYNKIYLSSLENQDIFDFYNTWSTRLPLIPLGNNNIMQAIHDDNSLLIYAEDLFPECNKLSVIELWNKLITYVIKQNANFCYISKEYATVKENETNNLALFVQKFDQGFHAVSIVDENDKFISVVLRSTFKQDFPKKNFRRWNNLYIDYSDDEGMMRLEIAKWCFGTARRELPILKNFLLLYMDQKNKFYVEKFLDFLQYILHHLHNSKYLHNDNQNKYRNHYIFHLILIEI